MVNSIKIVESPQCQFFVLRKKRLCRMTVRPGRQYCGEHEPPPPPGDEVDQRVPCPNDPKHTVYISKMEKHLSKCNARRTVDPPYIEYNVNAPADPSECPRVPLKDVPQHMLDAVIEKINRIYDEHIKATITSVDHLSPHHRAVTADIEQADRCDSSRRHLRQVSRLLQLVEENTLPDDTCYLEMGAGKGALSYYAARAWCSCNSSRVLAIEVSAARHKRDTRAPAARRLRADLAHVLAARLPAVSAASAVYGLAKHLCGVATDYALRCICAESVVSKTAGCVVATCCHHRCTPRGLVGAHHLQELGISREELNIIFSLVSWATCGDGRPRQPRRDTTHRESSRGQADYETNRGQADSETNRGHRERNDDNHRDRLPQEHDDTSREGGHNETNGGHQARSETNEGRGDNERRKNRQEDYDTRHFNETHHHESDDSCEEREDHDKTSREYAQHNEALQGHDEMSEEHKSDESNLQDSNGRFVGDDAATNDTSEIKDSNGRLSNEAASNETSEVRESNGRFVDDTIRSRREEIGRRAKAVVDWGRVLYLRQRGFTARLVQYVPAADSLENMCIVAHKPIQ